MYIVARQPCTLQSDPPSYFKYQPGTVLSYYNITDYIYAVLYVLVINLIVKFLLIDTIKMCKICYH